MKEAAAEFIGTFALVFCGTGSIILNDLSGGTVTHGGVSLAFGVIVFLMICAFGDVSGAHFNPAVSLGFAIARRLPARRLPLYFASQLAGAVTASFCLKLLFADHKTLGGTYPTASLPIVFVTEIILTMVLMFVILAVSTRAKERGLPAGISIGAVITAAAFLGGPISGASLNPARSLGPALAATNLQSLWIYLTAPFIGTALAIPLCRWARPAGCRCVAQETPC